jgi:hypothetical protein
MYINTSSNYSNLIEFNDNYDTTPLTSDIYTLDAEEEKYFLQEFPVLQASSVPESKPVLKLQQTEAQKDATKLLKAKFRYPTRDPQPNVVQDNRTELEKIQSILRTTSQILDKDTLHIWNSICERNLHLSKQHNSGIPLLKSNISDEIKAYRLNKQHEDQLLQQVSTFDKLYVKEQPIKTVPPESDPEAQQTSPMTVPTEMPEDIMNEPVDCFNTSTSPITARIVLSKQLYYLWNTSSDLNQYNLGSHTKRIP